MPTRAATKPTSYTFTGNQIAAYLFNDAEISGSTVTDVSGNGENLTLQGSAATEATDSAHGKCLRGNGGGALTDPSAAFDSLQSYTVIASFFIEDNENLSGTTEIMAALENTASSQDSLVFGWLTSENVFCSFEDGDTSVTATITDGIINNAGEWVTVACVLDGAAGDVALYVIVDGDATQVATLSATGVTSSTSVNNILSFVTGWHGLGETLQVFPEAWNQTQVDAWHVDPYSDFGTGGGSVELVVADCSHGHSVDNLSMTQANTLVANDAAHGHASDNVALTQANTLSTNDSMHSQSIDSVELVQGYQLAANDSNHAHSAESVALTQQSTLSPAGALHSHAADSVVLMQANLLSVSDALHAHGAESITLELAGVLVVQDSIHAQVVDGVVLVQANIIAVDDAAHAHDVDSVTLSVGVTISPSDAQHAHSVDGLTLTHGHLLSISDANHAMHSDVVGLIQSGALIVSDALHAHIVENLTLGGGSFQIGGRLMVISGLDWVMPVTAFDRVVKATES